MARTALTFCLLLAFFTCWAGAARASVPVYTVNDVKVDILAESAVKARDKAFGEAQKAAFMKLAGRFRSTSELATLTPPDARTIAGMVQDFELVSEQLSTRRYLGTYTFRFKVSPVNRYFGSGPSYEDPTAATHVTRAGLMVLPFFRQGTGPAVLWDPTKNPWLQAWQKVPLDGNPALLLPMGDMSDMMDVRDNQVTDFNPAGLKRMLARYEARDAVILLAKFDAAARNPLSIDVYRTDRNGATLMKEMPIQNGTSRTLGQLMGKAIGEVKEVLAGNWKLETIVQDTPVEIAPEIEPAPVIVDQTVLVKPQPEKPMLGGSVRAQVRFSNMSEWLGLRRTLNSVPSLTGVRIVALKANEAVVDLTYNDWPTLGQQLLANGLSLQGGGAGMYQLSGGAAPFRY